MTKPSVSSATSAAASSAGSKLRASPQARRRLPAPAPPACRARSRPGRSSGDQIAPHGRPARRSPARARRRGHKRLEVRQALGGDPQPGGWRSAAARRAFRAAAATSHSFQPAWVSASVRQPSQTSASCSSSAFAGSGQASSAHARRSPRHRAGRYRMPAPHRASAVLITAWVRRSSSGASSR